MEVDAQEKQALPQRDTTGDTFTADVANAVSQVSGGAPSTHSTPLSSVRDMLVHAWRFLRSATIARMVWTRLRGAVESHGTGARAQPCRA